MDYYSEIKNKLIDNETYQKVKDYSKERHKLITYFEIGKLLKEAGSVYGEDIVGKYSEKLQKEVAKKYDKTMLFRMRQLYVMMSNEKVAPLVQFLNWSQCLMLIPMKDFNKIYYYAMQVIIRKLSKRELQDAIKNQEYERLDYNTKQKLFNNSEHKIMDFIKNPILIRNKRNCEVITEKVLQQLILEDIPTFLDELGVGFTFIKNEYKIKIGDVYNYIDLLLFNYEYNCFVVVELKVTEIKKEHIGQIQVYMNYIDKNLRKAYQDNTIGIIICKKNNRFIIEYCSDKRVLGREYKIIG